jgi:putative NADPH-quinone reductase
MRIISAVHTAISRSARPELAEELDSIDEYDTIILMYPKMEYAI